MTKNAERREVSCSAIYIEACQRHIGEETEDQLFSTMTAADPTC